MQTVGAKLRRGHCRAQQVTVVEQESAVALVVNLLAVVDADESLIFAQPTGDLPG